MNKDLQFLLVVILGFILMILVTPESYGNAVLISLAVIFASYLVFETTSEWRKNPKNMWSSKDSDIKITQPTTQVLLIEHKKDEVLLVPLTPTEKKFQLLIDILTAIYIVTFGYVLFDMFQPLHGSGQAQNGMQAFLLLLLAVPISIILSIIIIYLYSKKTLVNK